MAISHTAPSNSSGPLFDAREAARHLALLAPDEENFIFVSFVEDKARDVPINTRFGSLKDHSEWIVERERDGCGLYIAIQSMTGRRRRNSEVAFIRAIYGEFDNGLPENLPLEPSLIIETSPNHFHVYWFTDPEDPITASDFAAIMQWHGCEVSQRSQRQGFVTGPSARRDVEPKAGTATASRPHHSMMSDRGMVAKNLSSISSLRKQQNRQ